MGKVVVPIHVENIGDAVGAMKGDMAWDQVRAVDLPDALVDTGATLLLLPKKIIERLGLVQFRTRQAKGLRGTIPMPIYSAVRLTVQGRDCTIDVGEIGDDFPAIIGQIPLEMMDWVIDTRGQKLIGNPEHGGEQIIEVFAEIKNRKPEIEELLLEGVEALEQGDAIEMTSEDWQRLRSEYMRTIMREQPEKFHRTLDRGFYHASR